LLAFQQSILYADAALVSYYKFEEGSGTTASDSQGSNTGILTDGVEMEIMALLKETLNLLKDFQDKV